MQCLDAARRRRNATQSSFVIASGPRVDNPVRRCDALLKELYQTVRGSAAIRGEFGQQAEEEVQVARRRISIPS